MQCLTYKRRLHVSSVQVLSCTKMVNDVALSHLCINKCQLGDPDVAKAIAVAVLYMYVIFDFFLLSVIVNIYNTFKKSISMNCQKTQYLRTLENTNSN